MSDIFKAPFRYDNYGQMIFDKDNNLVLDIRGWGAVKYKNEPEKIQDDFGEHVVKLLNQKSKLDQLKEWLYRVGHIEKGWVSVPIDNFDKKIKELKGE